MAELEEKLQAILSDPEAMGQIASIAQALTGGEAASVPPSQTQEAECTPTAPGGTDGGPDLSALLGALGGGSSSPLSALSELDPKLLQAGMELLSEYSAEDDRKVTLLNALKPFLKPERGAKIDQAVRIAKLVRVIRIAFRLFQSRQEEEDDV